MSVEGRWYVNDDGSGGGVRAILPRWLTPFDKGYVPVVPCDDAAIERVARALFEDYSSEYETTWEQDRDAFMTAAEKVLRAAGETP